LALVGDVHDQWFSGDAVALKALHPDMTLFVGDIGNENLQLVRRIAALDVPKKIILGNHDAFYTHEPMIRSELNGTGKVDVVNAQLDALGEDHIGFGSGTVTGKPVTIVGARPFSGGGRVRHPQLIENLYGYKGTEQCAQVIAQTAVAAPDDHAVVIMGHNGPSGLGARRHDICGIDFRPEEGDHGDDDLKQALFNLKQLDRSPALVVFGHMHSSLHRSKQFRKRLVFDLQTETLFLNVAVVPRVKTSSHHINKVRRRHRQTSTHHFCIVEIENGCVSRVEDVYVAMSGTTIIGNFKITPLFKRIEESGFESVRVFDTHLQTWTRHNLQPTNGINPLAIPQTV